MTEGIKPGRALKSYRPAHTYRAARRNQDRNLRAEQLKAERKRTGETRREQDRRREAERRAKEGGS